jgi:hypothetical protein
MGTSLIAFLFVTFASLIAGAQSNAHADSARRTGAPIAETPVVSNTTEFPEDSVGPDDPVITLDGTFTPAGVAAKSAPSCKTIITRLEFDRLVDSINLAGKKVSMGARQNIAKTYAEYLVYQQAAIKAGLDKTDRYAEIMRWVQARVLTDLMRAHLAEQYHNQSAEDIAKYYREHTKDFERLHIARVMVPRNVPLAMTTSSEGEKEERLLTAANEARSRLLKGEDAEQVQKDIYNKLGIGAPPPTDLGQEGRKDFQTEEVTEVFSLKPGEVSKVEKELASYVVYKVVARETISEEDATNDIARELARTRIEQANREITDSVKPEYNGKYFGPPVAEPAGPGAPGHP